jgi:tRNA threonylcarbamoyl adenosine modification protein YeaZ
MNTVFLVAQATYDQVEIGLFSQTTLIAQQTLEKSSANKLLTNSIEQLLSNNNYSLNDLSFIAVNRGPAPFTTLRVVLATMNGISFASGIKLVGIDGLSAFALENADAGWPYSAYLFNAFNDDVYFAIERPMTQLEIGCIKIDQLIAALEPFKNMHWRFLGNGALLFEQKIAAHFQNYQLIRSPSYSSLQSIANQAVENYHTNQFCGHQVLPLYLKEAAYKKSIKPS